jgi:hypothetical protein
MNGPPTTSEGGSTLDKPFQKMLSFSSQSHAAKTDSGQSKLSPPPKPPKPARFRAPPKKSTANPTSKYHDALREPATLSDVNSSASVNESTGSGQWDTFRRKYPPADELDGHFASLDADFNRWKLH